MGVLNHIVAFAVWVLGVVCQCLASLVVSLAVINALPIVIIRGDNFIRGGKMGSCAGDDKVQFIRAPPMIAPVPSASIGMVTLRSSSFVDWAGRLMLWEFSAVSVRRVE